MRKTVQENCNGLSWSQWWIVWSMVDRPCAHLVMLPCLPGNIHQTYCNFTVVPLVKCCFCVQRTQYFSLWCNTKYDVHVRLSWTPFAWWRTLVLKSSSVNEIHRPGVAKVFFWLTSFSRQICHSVKSPNDFLYEKREQFLDWLYCQTKIQNFHECVLEGS